MAPRVIVGRPRAVARAAAAAGTLGIALLLSAPAGVLGDASHAGWPKINGLLLIDKGPAGQHHVLRGLKNKHNELLGGYGNDTIYGGSAGDVIWADYLPSGQPSNQVTTIHAGNGKNFIYTSHATNFIHTGTDPATIVHAIFGGGRITCGSPRQQVDVSHASRPRYKLVGCHVVIQ
jgi:Ca2+-binding RTX toxin-like protein